MNACTRPAPDERDRRLKELEAEIKSLRVSQRISDFALEMNRNDFVPKVRELVFDLCEILKEYPDNERPTV